MKFNQYTRNCGIDKSEVNHRDDIWKLRIHGLILCAVYKRFRAGIPPRYVISHLRQLSLLPSVGHKMRTSQSAVMRCGLGCKAG